MSILPSITALVAAAAVALSAAPAAPSRPPAGAGVLIERYIEENEIPPSQLALGYRNTVTGEEYYVNGDTPFYGASLYKLALSMYYAEQVASGRMEWDTMIDGTTLDTLVTGILERSDNNYSFTLTQALGAYRASRIACAYLYGMTEEEAEADRQYATSRVISARRMIVCLDTLYTHGERYPTVIDHMLAAQPGEYFRRTEDRWEIAQKYGYLTQYGRDISAAGIIFAPEPFELVVMTHNLPHAEEHIAAICVLLGDYAAAHRAAGKPGAEPGAARIRNGMAVPAVS